MLHWHQATSESGFFKRLGLHSGVLVWDIVSVESDPGHDSEETDGPTLPCVQYFSTSCIGTNPNAPTIVE